MRVSDNAPRDTFRRRIGPEEETSTAVVSAVAETTCTDPLELSPLYDVIDPDALDRVFAAAGSDRDGGGRVAFPFGDRWVAARSEGEVIVVREELNAPRDETYRARHEWTADAHLSDTLLRALEGLSRRRDLARAEPLAATVDPDALDRLFRPLGERSRRNDGWLSFPFEGYAVTVEASGRIRIAPASRFPTDRRGDGEKREDDR